MPIRDEAINVFMGLPGDGDRLELTYNHGVDSYELGTGYNHIALTVDDLDATLARAGREGHRAREAAVHRARGRHPDLLRARPGRLPGRADRDRLRPTGAAAPRRHRPRVELVPARGLHLGAAGRARWWWKRTDEIYEPVRIGEGQDGPGELQARADGARAGDDRAVRALLPRHRRRRGPRAGHLGDPRGLQPRGVPARRRASAPGLEIQVLSREEEARYGYLAAVNSTTLTDGVALDLGGGSMQLTRWRAAARATRARGGWARCVMTERFLPDERATKPKQHQGAHARTCATSSRRRRGSTAPGARAAGWPASAARCATSPRRRSSPPDLPSYGVQGFALTRDALDELIEELAELPAAERGGVPGIKPERGDLILAGALVIQTVMEAGGFDALEATEAGLREGVFFEALLDGADPPLFDGRPPRGACCNLAAQYHADFAHTEHVARLALEIWDALGRRRRSTPATRGARAAVGGGDAARHRHGRRLRRPPQALALPGPQRRPAGLHAARDRADRPDGPLPPQGQPVAGRVRAAGARRRRGLLRALRGGAAGGRAARAPARPDRAAAPTSRSTTARSSCACAPTRTSTRRALGGRAPGRAVRARVRARARRPRVTVPLYTRRLPGAPGLRGGADARAARPRQRRASSTRRCGCASRAPGLVRQARRVRARLRRRRRGGERAGFAAVHRVGGGRAAVFHEGTILFSHVAARRGPAPAHARPLPRLAAACSRRCARSASTTRGSAPCPASTAPATTASAPGGSSSSASPSGSSAARRARRACSWCTGGDRVRAVLEPVYAALGLDWDPRRGRPRRGRWTTRWRRCARRWRARRAAGEARLDAATLALRRGAREPRARRLGRAPATARRPSPCAGPRRGCSPGRVGPTGPTSISSRSPATASTISTSSSPCAPPPGSASQVTRMRPVGTVSSPTTTRPQMTSPSSQPMRSTSNQARWTSVALPPQGQPPLSWRLPGLADGAHVLGRRVGAHGSECRRTPGLRSPRGSTAALAARSAAANGSGRWRSYHGRWSRPTAWWWVIVPPAASTASAAARLIASHCPSSSPARAPARAR